MDFYGVFWSVMECWSVIEMLWSVVEGGRVLGSFVECCGML